MRFLILGRQVSLKREVGAGVRIYLGPIIISFEAVAKVFMNHAHM